VNQFQADERVDRALRGFKQDARLSAGAKHGKVKLRFPDRMQAGGRHEVTTEYNFDNMTMEQVEAVVAKLQAEAARLSEIANQGGS
jgi:hypothetical protein